MNEMASNREADNGIVDVEIAGAGRRIAAYLINILLTLLAYVPLIAGIISALPEGVFSQGAAGNEEAVAGMLAEADWSGSWIWFGLAVMAVYGLGQIWLMSRSGQSFGKKIMQIRVLKSDGRNPGFWGTVVLREILFNIIVTFAAMIAGYLLALAAGSSTLTADTIGNVLSFVPWIICLFMLFNKSKNRRTLQDMLADTVVVRLPGK
ncbi:RDD family protein [Neisseria sp.]|uniref:RDD family protein n=1 Tax=Neisseria sp. TaxID=192066 RepID=UPI0026DC3C24|nr:RDD family protein [Neisseria sp.]MDO4907910.1 RDD family protein [Neisseria sp.]